MQESVDNGTTNNYQESPQFKSSSSFKSEDDDEFIES